MRIGIDISQVVYEGTGVARFTAGLVRGLLRYGKGHAFVFFAATLRRSVPPDLVRDIRSSGHELKRMPVPPTGLAFAWNTLRFPPIDLIVPDLDWFVTSDWTEPPARCKKATIVHDLAFRRFPETIDPTIMAVFTKKLDLVKAESQVVFADSQSTATDLQEFYGIEPDRIAVVYPGVNAATSPEQGVTTGITKKYGLAKPYLFTVGKIEPRKNLGRLLDAYRAWASPDVELAIAGPKGWDTVAPVPGVRLLGFVPDADLPALYSGALGLVYPSLWEGFGYPAVEAMQRGTPVALSNRSSLAEIGADAALQFDPENTQEITAAMERIATDAELRANLSQKGRARAADFTWERYVTTFLRELESRR